MFSLPHFTYNSLVSLDLHDNLSYYKFDDTQVDGLICLGAYYNCFEIKLYVTLSQMRSFILIEIKRKCRIWLRLRENVEENKFRD